MPRTVAASSIERVMRSLSIAFPPVRSCFLELGREEHQDPACVEFGEDPQSWRPGPGSSHVLRVDGHLNPSGEWIALASSPDGRRPTSSTATSLTATSRRRRLASRPPRPT
jgi:hypothetical protein